MDNKNVHKQTGDLKICSINICGVSERSQLVLDKYNDNNSFDIIAVQETATGKPDPKHLHLSNMSVISDSNKSANKGCAIFVKDKYSLTNLPEISAISKNIDTVWCLGVFDGKRIVIGTAYLKLGYPKGVAELISMLEKAKTLAKDLRASGVVLCGDLNSRHTLFGDKLTDAYGKKLIEEIDHCSYSILYPKSPSFIAVDGASSVIDMFIVSNNIESKLSCPVTDVEVELFSGAPYRGHVPVITSIDMKIKASTPGVEKICYDKIDWGDWSRDLDALLLKTTRLEDPGETWDQFQVALDSATDKHTEKKIVTTHSKPFWTEELTILSKSLRKAKKVWYKRNTDSNRQKMTAAKFAFDDARMRECKSFILRKTATLNTAESHKFWKEFNKLFGKKTNNSVDSLDDGAGGLITDTKDKEELMFDTFFGGKHLDESKFDRSFMDKINDMYEDIKAGSFAEKCSESLSDDDKPKDTDQLLILLNREISMEEIRSSIKSYQISGKSVDQNQFHPRMLKNLGPVALAHLHRLYNQCFDLGIWVWDDAEVIFLRKPDKKSYADPGAYRPISISSYPGKVYERIMAERIEWFMQLAGHLDLDQEGFFKGRNTIRYLNRLHLGIKADIERKLTVLCLFIDFEKAFDSVPKKALIYKLYQLGIRGKMLKLLDSFLFGKKVKINIDGIVGALRLCLEFGLPQGSALSPILFRIYVLDLFASLTSLVKAQKLKFADDGTVKVSAGSLMECIALMKTVLSLTNVWSMQWRMIINCKPNKTELICFNVSKEDKESVPTSMKLGDNDIMFVNKTKVLGVIFDKDLKFKDHSAMVYRKLAFRWVSVCKYSNRNWGFSQQVMVQLIKSIFQSCLFYASHIWMRQDNMVDINRLWYKLLKSSVGAVLNVRLDIAEVILGIPPIQTMNKISRIKHCLKLAGNATPGDRLVEFFKAHLILQDCRQLTEAMKDVYQFLQWKLSAYPKLFTYCDIQIIHSRSYSDFFSLSDVASYNKSSMTQYTEHVWQLSLKNRFMIDGYAVIPRPSCTKLQLQGSVSRETEVLLMSMFYDNNLLNGSLFKVNRKKFLTADCECEESIQDSYHILLECSWTQPQMKQQCLEVMKSILPSSELNNRSHLTLLNCSRNKKFISSVLSILETSKLPLRRKVILSSSNKKKSDDNDTVQEDLLL